MRFMKTKIFTILALMLCMGVFCVPAYASGDEPVSEDTEIEETVSGETSESAISDSSNAFTPDGTGEVLDNATDGDGKEFFTITTEAGNVFFLVIDREKTSDNVYFLGAVTEDDLMALATKDDGTTESAVPDTDTTEQAQTTTEPEIEPMSEPEIEDSSSKGNSNGFIIIIVLAVVAVGGAGYYFKIYRPKQQNAEPDDESDDYDDYEGEDDVQEDEEIEMDDDAE